MSRVFTLYKIWTLSQHWAGTTILALNLQKVNEEFPLPYHTPHHKNMMLNGFYEEQVSLQLLQAAPCYLCLDVSSSQYFGGQLEEPLQITQTNFPEDDIWWM